MRRCQELDSFPVDREDPETWMAFVVFVGANTISRGQPFTHEHACAINEMLAYDIPRRITDARRLERWLYENAENTISQFKLFRP